MSAYSLQHDEAESVIDGDENWARSRLVPWLALCRHQASSVGSAQLESCQSCRFCSGSPSSPRVNAIQSALVLRWRRQFAIRDPRVHAERHRRLRR